MDSLFEGSAQPTRRCGIHDSGAFQHTFSARKCAFCHSGQPFGALQRKETRPTLKTLFYNANLKVFGLRPARSRVRNSCFRSILTHFFCAKVCILSFWATFWSATEEGNASNAQNLVLQCIFKGFWAPPTARGSAKMMILEHLNTQFF